MKRHLNFEVVIVGGGHAGCEAAHAAARMGCRTALLTLEPSKIGVMSCNPAIGGLAKGQLVKEIDALGGLMGRVTDQSSIQFRRLNESKGPAVRSSRAQCDKRAYAQNMQRVLTGVPGLEILSGEMVDLRLEKANGWPRVTHLVLKDGSEIRTSQVVITSGTFLRAVMHLGKEQHQGGRVGEAAATGLSLTLEDQGFRLRRLKTGTPPRLDKKTINFNKLKEQPGDRVPIPFSFYQKLAPFPYLKQLSCYLTHTNIQTHEIIEKNLKTSPLFNGQIQGVGPRYCPSIEDKVHRFAGRDRHLLFLEPEGHGVDEIYVNGISTSLSRSVQEKFVRSIEGLEEAQFLQHGYAVEYDSLDARQLKRTLESKDIQGLFFAGQVNGTSGYEEAGAQGLVAGVNAGLNVQGKDPWILTRMDSYAGVMIDDLTLKGSDEPYRMFTSRAEYRLLLREDNADLRLSARGHALGLLSEEDFRIFEEKRLNIRDLRKNLDQFAFKPNEITDKKFDERSWPRLKDRILATELLKRPQASWQDLLDLGFPGGNVPRGTSEQVEIQIKYAGYIKRDQELLEGVRKNEHLRIPSEILFDEVAGLSNEIRGRLQSTRPETIGQVSRIQGVTPAAVANLLIHIKMRGKIRGRQSAH